METPRKEISFPAPVEPGFWLRWVLANIAGFGGAGVLVMATIQRAIDWMDHVVGHPANLVLAVCYFAWAGFLFVGGIPGGILQWLVLRRKFAQAGSWIWRSMLGTAACIPVSLIIAVPGFIFIAFWTFIFQYFMVGTVVGMGLVGTVTGGLEGAVFGILQWHALRRKFPQAGQTVWVPGNALGGAVGSGLLAALAGGMMGRPWPPGDQIHLGAPGLLGAGCAAGAAFGVITGLALVGPSRHPAVPEGELHESTRDKLLAVGASMVVLLVTIVLVFGLASDTSLVRIPPAPTKSFSLSDMAWSPDGRQLASSWMDGLIVWDVETGEQLHTLERDNYVTGVAWSPDGARVAAALRDSGTIILWDAATGKKVRTLSGHGEWVNTVAWSPVGTRLASGASLGSTIIVWDVETGGKLRTLTEDHGGTFRLAWSPDGTRLASCYGGGALVLWDGETGKQLRTLPGESGYSCDLAWSPDGTELASHSWAILMEHNYPVSTIILWDVETGEKLHVLTGQYGRSGALTWSPAGIRLASGEDSTILWDVETGEKLRTLDGRPGALSWSPDGTRLASGAGGGTIIIWDVATGKQLRTLRRL